MTSQWPMMQGSAMSKRCRFIIALVLVNFFYINVILFTREGATMGWHQLTSGRESRDENHNLLPSSAYDVMMDKLLTRTMRVREECLRRKETAPIQLKTLKNTEFPWIYVSHRFETLYCQIPKVGSSGWMKVIGAMEGRINGTEDPRPIHNVPLLLLSYLNHTERDRVMRNYTKIMMTREPFERVVSAYRDKFLPRAGPPVFRNLANQIVDRYRNGNRTARVPASLKFQAGVPTFDEFIAYVTDPANDVIEAHYSEPRHWQRQIDICYPCKINYDYVIDIAQVDDESEVVLTSLGVPQYIRYPEQTKMKKRSQVLPQYSEVAVEHFIRADPRLVNKLYHYYKRDFETFGFPAPPQF